MVNKTDLILKKIDFLQVSSTKIQIDVAGMKQHLKSLNGLVQRNESRLNSHSKDIGRMKGAIRYFTGIGTALILFYTFFGDKIKRMFIG